MKERRYTVLQHAEKAEDCHVVAAFEPENIFYLTGFWGEAIAVCMDNGTTTKLITPKLEYSRAQKASIDCEVFPTERGSELISTFVSQVKGSRVCSDCSDYSTIGSIRKHGGDILVNTDPFFLTRMIKDHSEIKVISRAAKILDKLYEICKEEIKVGL
jgi:Xaa-Pro aminopeptidase